MQMHPYSREGQSLNTPHLCVRLHLGHHHHHHHHDFNRYISDMQANVSKPSQAPETMSPEAEPSVSTETASITDGLSVPSFVDVKVNEFASKIDRLMRLSTVSSRVSNAASESGKPRDQNTDEDASPPVLTAASTMETELVRFTNARYTPGRRPIWSAAAVQKA